MISSAANAPTAGTSDNLMKPNLVKQVAPRSIERILFFNGNI